MNESQIMSVLKRAYQIEIDGYTFYSMAADRADKPAVGEIFSKLADDEVLHQLYLKEIMGNYQDKGVKAFQVTRSDPEARAASSMIFSDSFKKQLEGTDFELGVLSIGMTLETRAMQYFSGAAENASEAEVAEFYRFLADWEKQHFEALQDLYNGLRENYWAEGGFSPF